MDLHRYDTSCIFFQQHVQGDMAGALQGELNEQQKLFALEYLKDFNASRAARDAGYSEKTAYSQGQRLLKHVEVRKLLTQLLEARSAKLETDAEYVLLKNRAIVELDIIDILNDDLSLRPLSEWPVEWRKSLSGSDIKELFEYDDNGEKSLVGFMKRIRWPDKLKALELLGKHVNVKAFDDRILHEHRFDTDQLRTLADIVKDAKRKEVRDDGSPG